MAELIRPKGTEEGSYEWLQTKAELARKWAGFTDRDVRELVKYLADLRAHRWQQLILGADNWDHFCREILGYEPGFIREMEEGVSILKARGHEGTISPAMASSASGRSAKAAEATTGEVLPAGVNQHTPVEEVRQFAGPQTNRAESNGISPRQQRKLDALARQAPELLEKVKEGEISTHRACVQAGIVKVRSPLEEMKWRYPRLSSADQADFLEWVNQVGAPS